MNDMIGWIHNEGFLQISYIKWKSADLSKQGQV